jgi:phosphonopyruvate decarboxylase
MTYIGIPDKILCDWLKDKEYIAPADEGEAIGIAAGIWLATGKRATVFMSADGLMNALNPLTSYVIPEGIEMNIVVSTGRQEPPHKVASDMLPNLLKILPYEPARVDFQIVRKE